MKLWMILPAISLLTLVYLGLGINGHWRYTNVDFLNGNIMVICGIGLIYLTKKVLKKDWDF